MQEYGPLKEMQAAAKKVEGFTVLSAGDELFEGGGMSFRSFPRLDDIGLPVFRGVMPGPGIADSDFTKAVPDGAFQNVSARLTEPAEKKFMRKADRQYGIRREGEGKRGEPCPSILALELTYEYVFYLRGIGNKAPILAFWEGGKAPFSGI
jgi:hypothetical protein